MCFRSFFQNKFYIEALQKTFCLECREIASNKFSSTRFTKFWNLRMKLVIESQ